MMMLIRQLRGGRRRRQSRSKYKDGHGAWGTLHAVFVPENNLPEQIQFFA